MARRRSRSLSDLRDLPPSAAKEVARTGYADTGEVEVFAQDLPERFLHCREMNHNWRPYTVGRHKDGGYERVLR